MPIFSGGPTTGGLEEKNSEVFKSLGYDVIPVRSRAHERNGVFNALG